MNAKVSQEKLLTQLGFDHRLESCVFLASKSYPLSFRTHSYWSNPWYIAKTIIEICQFFHYKILQYFSMFVCFLGLAALENVLETILCSWRPRCYFFQEHTKTWVNWKGEKIAPSEEWLLEVVQGTQGGEITPTSTEHTSRHAKPDFFAII